MTILFSYQKTHIREDPKKFMRRNPELLEGQAFLDRLHVFGWGIYHAIGVALAPLELSELVMPHAITRRLRRFIQFLLI